MNEQRKSVHEQRKAVNAQRKAVVRQCVRLRAVGGWTIAATATAAAVLQLCLRLRHGGGLRLHVVCSGEGCCGCGSNELCDFELSIYNQMMIAPDLISNAETRGSTAAPPTKKFGAPSVAAASMGASTAFYSSDWHVSATTSCAPEIFRWTIMHRWKASVVSRGGRTVPEATAHCSSCRSRRARSALVSDTAGGGSRGHGPRLPIA